MDTVSSTLDRIEDPTVGRKPSGVHPVVDRQRLTRAREVVPGPLRQRGEAAVESHHQPVRSDIVHHLAELMQGGLIESEGLLDTQSSRE